jgi:hypothetical protein
MRKSKKSSIKKKKIDFLGYNLIYTDHVRQWLLVLRLRRVLLQRLPLLVWVLVRLMRRHTLL